MRCSSLALLNFDVPRKAVLRQLEALWGLETCGQNPVCYLGHFNTRC